MTWNNWRVIETYERGPDAIYIHEIYNCMIIHTTHYFGGDFFEGVLVSLTHKNGSGVTKTIFASHDVKANQWAERIIDELLEGMTDEVDYLPVFVKPFFENN